METIEVDQPGGRGGCIRLSAFWDNHFMQDLSFTEENLDFVISELRKFQTPTRLESPVE
jgi:hypothetical protein